MNLDKEEQLLRRRFLDLANTADNRGICIFSDFLNLNEQSILFSIKHDLPIIKYFAYGGFADAERKILCFCGDDTLQSDAEINYPITCIKIEPLNKKFSDTLTHRDFLGAVLNLGIDRGKVGDIITMENEAYLFCTSSISEFIADELIKVKHTMIRSSIIDKSDFKYQPVYKEISGTVSSIRLDSILSVAFHTSRSSLTGLIAGGKVFVNSKVVLSNSYVLKENDVVSVRGLGKFIYVGTSNITKKGRYSIKIRLYTA
ncbi:RNA-binding protein [Mobilitalea sibirica]|uniref:RNA-binding protein n=1 Tax=Mobilitalea sibirica TaxID=1462919 RepID=A0A8J7L2L3_9FIRM|nr:YlmH/Sll1252 family protein [Mobilitalea sibirica]MBH1940883.1 RNA-binding protein [Mobilitalea sibirica]